MGDSNPKNEDKSKPQISQMSEAREPGCDHRKNLSGTKMKMADPRLLPLRICEICEICGFKFGIWV